MLTKNELADLLELKHSLGLPLDEGACFGVSDKSRLRPAFKTRKAPKEPVEKVFFLGTDHCVPGLGLEYLEVVTTLARKYHPYSAVPVPCFVLRNQDGEYKFFPIHLTELYELYAENQLRAMASETTTEGAIKKLQEKLQKS